MMHLHAQQLRRISQLHPVHAVCAIKTNFYIHTSHLKSSISYDRFQTTSLSPNDIVVVYCANWHCSASEKIASELQSKIPNTVFEFTGGILEWAIHAQCDPQGDYMFKDEFSTPIDLTHVFSSIQQNNTLKYTKDPSYEKSVTFIEKLCQNANSVPSCTSSI